MRGLLCTLTVVVVVSMRISSLHSFSVIGSHHHQHHYPSPQPQRQRQRQKALLHSNPTSEDEIPSMDWLTKGTHPLPSSANEKSDFEGDMEMMRHPFIEEHSAESGLGDVPIPTTGVSIADAIADASVDVFVSKLIPIRGLNKGVRAAQIVSTERGGSYEAVRYVIGLSKEKETSDNPNNNSATAPNQETDDFVLVDIPPYSDQLKTDIQSYIGEQGRIAAILITCRDSIHYDEGPGVLAARRPDLPQWKEAFDGCATVAYRLDVPRDCHDSITHRLDGQGPFAIDEVSTTRSTNHNNNGTTMTKHPIDFIETGRPLTMNEWDADIREDIVKGVRPPPKEDSVDETVEINELYTPEAIRAREEGRRILAIWTPARTFGSMTYVFPEIGLCTSGFVIPVEESRMEENSGLDKPGPALDTRGYITTNRAGVKKHMDAASHLINNYVDRFNVVLPSRNDPLFLDDDNVQERRTELLEIIDQYKRIGEIYEQLGIIDGDSSLGP